VPQLTKVVGNTECALLALFFLIERNQPEKRAKNASLRDEKGKSTTTNSISGSKTTFRDA